MTSASAVGVEFDDPDLEASVRAALHTVEVALAAAVRSDDQFVSGAAGYLVDAGGKRFRPLVTTLAAHFGDPTRIEIVPAAVVVELTHLATLYHDDVMDEALVRRGAASANARWDNTVAILTGDFLFSRASNLLADLGPWAVKLQASTFERLVIGQIHETVGPAEGADAIEHYLSVLADKTGSLIATSAEFGAHFAGVDAATVAQLREYAELVGVAFQIGDDILDIAASPSDSGKTPGTDLREGIATLPVLYALRDAAASTGTPAGADGARLRELVSHPLTDDAEHAEALTLLRAAPAIEQARATLRDHADKARAVLDGLPDLPARRALATLADTVVERTG